MKVLTLRKRAIVIGLCVLLCVAGVVIHFTAIRPTFQPKPQYTIVIDAGHGGRDGGAVGKTTETTESYLNLQFSLKLKSICEEYGFKVVLTRKDMNGIYSAFASNKKRSEMEKRMEIIESANPDLVVSIHMNSFSNSSARGAQVFYAENFPENEEFAQTVQDALNEKIPNAKKTAKSSDFYVINTTSKPSILVECGFLSNPEEERLLVSEEYQEDFCYVLFYGILSYFSVNNL